MNSGRTEYLVFEKTEDMWRFAAEKWRDTSFHAIQERGSFVAALSGGKTPVGFYYYLSDVEGLDWNRTHIFLVDERFVPPESPDSNYGMLTENLLKRISIPPANVHSVKETSSLIESVEEYEKELKAFFSLPEGGVPEFDLTLLGVGEDGHTASLFPGDEALRERRRLVLPVVLGTVLHDRITLTLPVINNSRNIFFLVRGRRKKAVMRKLQKGYDRTLPASMVSPERGNLIFLMDREAAA